MIDFFQLHKNKIITVSLLLILLKYVFISFFVHPIGDDFTYAFKGKNENMISCLIGEYLTWNGRYFSNVLVLINPISFNNFALYKAIPIVLIILSVFSFYYFIKTFMAGSLSKTELFNISLILSLLFFYQMPDLSEGIYWYTSAVTYHIANIMFLFYACLLYHFFKGKYICNSMFFSFLLLIFLLLINFGFNEIHVLIFVLMFSTIIIISHINKFNIIRNYSLVLLLISLLLALFVIVAPGNSLRASNFENNFNFFHSLKNSTAQTLRFFLYWTNSAVLILLSIFYIEFHKKVVKSNTLFAKSFYLTPLWSGLLLIIVIMSGSFPAYWATGIQGQLRTMNVSYFLFILLWFINLSVWINTFDKKHNLKINIPPIISMIFMIFIFLSLVFTKNGSKVVSDIYRKKLYSFDKQMKERYLLINSEQDTIYFKPIIDPPESIFVYDITDEPEHWKNASYSIFFSNNQKTIIKSTKEDELL